MAGLLLSLVSSVNILCRLHSQFIIMTVIVGVIRQLMSNSVVPDATSSLHPALVSTIKKLQTGYISGTRCVL